VPPGGRDERMVNRRCHGRRRSRGGADSRACREGCWPPRGKSEVGQSSTSRAILALITILAAPLAPATADGVSGSITVRADYYPESPHFPGQAGAGTQGSGLVNLKGFYQIGDALSVDAKLRAAWTPQGQEAMFADVEKAALGYQTGAWAIRAGVLDERWGVMTVEPISDVVNQRDFVSNYRGRDRLGQPGAALQYFGDAWSLTLIAATWKRERRLARGQDRFRNTALAYTAPEFEKGQWSPADLGARFFTSVGELELELTYFRGTAREPLLVPTLFDDGSVALTPTYRQMDQGGLAARYVIGDFVLRGEGYVRSENGTFGGAALGIERVFYRTFGGVADFIVYLEGYYDSRPEDTMPTPFDHDLAIGLRLLTNDAKGTALWLQTIYDPETTANLVEFEARRRLNDSSLGKFTVVTPVNAADDPALAGFQRDTQVTISVEVFF
jgi:hypothetical protein